MEPAVIIGASHAGVQAAASLRQAGWQDGIVLLSAEPDAPYHRPPLSKAYLAGTKDEAGIALRASGFYDAQNIDLRLATSAQAIELASRKVVTAQGDVTYSKLVLAMGGRVRTLPLLEGYENVLTLRDLADARALRAAIGGAKSLALIGGGFIGLEVAATAASAGLEVSVVEAARRVLARAVPEAVSTALQARHIGAGVRFYLDAKLEGTVSEGRRLTALRLTDGTQIDADLFLVGIGSTGSIELGREAGLAEAAGGLAADADGRTDAPDVYVIGDLAARDDGHGHRRIESVQNATDGARIAAAAIMGLDHPGPFVPWFWTDQYEHKLQMAGLPGAEATFLMRGDPEAGRFTVLAQCGGVLTGAYSMDWAEDHVASRRLILRRATLDLAAAADPSVPLAKAVAEPATTGT